jgi:hypothetical protein
MPEEILPMSTNVQRKNLEVAGVDPLGNGVVSNRNSGLLCFVGQL